MLDMVLERIAPFVDEIRAVDTGSDDGTVEIFKKYNAVVESMPFRDDFSHARNACIQRAQADWILVVDGDEMIAESDLNKLPLLMRDERYDGYLFEQRTYDREPREMWVANNGAYKEGQPYPGYYPVNIARFFRNKKNIRFSGRIHETVVPSIADDRIAGSSVVIHHYAQTIRDERQKEQKNGLYLRLGEMKVSEEPHSAKAFFELGRQYYAMGRYQDAANRFRMAVKLDQKNGWFQANYGFSCYKLNMIEQAFDALKNAVANGHGTPDTYSTLGITCYKLGKVDDALEMLKTALEYNPRHVGALNNMGLVYFQSGQYERARDCYSRIDSVLPSNLRTLNALSMCCEKTGSRRELVKIFRRMLNEFPESAGYIMEKLSAMETNVP